MSAPYGSDLYCGFPGPLRRRFLGGRLFGGRLLRRCGFFRHRLFGSRFLRCRLLGGGFFRRRFLDGCGGVSNPGGRFLRNRSIPV